VIAWLTEHASDLEPTLSELSEHEIQALHPKHVVLSAEVMQVLRRHFALINTWTVNQPERVVELSKLGIDTIITDDPAGALRALGEPTTVV
jgi:glycerophosphoryl diester phosphodiesterase